MASESLSTKLRELAAKATDAPWVYDGTSINDCGPGYPCSMSMEWTPNGGLDEGFDINSKADHDAALTVLLRNHALQLADALDAVEALRKIMPIRVHDGPDYAEVYFSDGVAHSTQAMTMNPQDWRDIAACVGPLPGEG